MAAGGGWYDTGDSTVVLNVKAVPLLGTGKSDYVGVKTLADELTAARRLSR